MMNRSLTLLVLTLIHNGSCQSTKPVIGRQSNSELLVSLQTSKQPASTVPPQHRSSPPDPSTTAVNRPPISTVPLPPMPLVGGARNANQQLLKKLFSNYIKEAMPDRPVVVHFDVLLLKLKASVEKEGIFESVLGLFIEWQDKRMMWNPMDFDGLSLLTFDADQVWLPDIAMTNSADHLYAISRDTRFVVRVTNSGLFKFVPTGTARTWCDLKLLTFPFDFQTCTLEFESWSMNSSEMTFDWHSRLLIDSQFSSTEWSLCQYRTLTYEHLYEFTNETFTRVEFEFIVKRKSTFYVINLIFPCATLSVIQLLVFLISSTDTTVDRISFGTTNLLTLVVFQTIVTAEMPKTSDAVTALSKYIIALIMIATVGIFESVLVERMLSTGLRPPPALLVTLLRYVPVLWREKPDPMKHELKEFTGELIKQYVHSTGRIALSINGRRSSILSGGLGRRSPSVVEDSNASTESLAHGDENESSSSNGNVDCEEPPLQINQKNRFYLKKGHINSKNLRRYNSGRFGSHGGKKATGGRLQSVENGASDCHQKKGSKAANQARNALMWTEVAYRIDFITLVTCGSLALFIPLGLFGPLSMVNERCSDSAKDFYDQGQGNEYHDHD